MKRRPLGATDLEVSEVGFDVRSVSADWRGKMSERDAVSLLENAHHAGITLFDTSDTDGGGYEEEALAKALGTHRHDIVIGTKFGCGIYSNEAREERPERPRDLSSEHVRYVCEQSLRRLKTDYIDLYQMHNPSLAALERDEPFETLEQLVSEGKIRYYGVAIGPGVGRFKEGEAAMRERRVRQVQVVYNILEHEPARRLFPIAEEEETGLLTRAPHASGLLDGRYAKETARENSDLQEWLERGLKKVSQLDFLTEGLKSTIGQIAVKFALAAPMVASVLPTITTMPQLRELAAAPETEDIPPELLERITELYEADFNLEPALPAS